ncbi:Uncharacterised protein [uncultured archaeon]|nr:Uncharacterised protein [uncultured archaeon]
MAPHSTAMMMTVAMLHLLGSRPRSPKPLVTMGRIYASRRLFWRSVSRIASHISSWVIGTQSMMAWAESNSL